MKQALIFFLSVLLFTSCKKDKDEPSLKGKWTVEQSILKIYASGTLVHTETQPGEGATMDFQASNNLVVTDDSGAETLQYTLMEGSKVKIDEEIYDIKDLTASSVTLYHREDDTDGYAELFVNLKR